MRALSWLKDLISSERGNVFVVSAAVMPLLLGTAAWKTAAQEPLLLLCLIGGMATSIIGMALRYYSYRREGA